MACTCLTPPAQPPSHVLLLNKFNVVDHHTLVVTAAFEHQTAALTADDMGATWSVVSAYPGPGAKTTQCWVACTWRA